MTVITEESQIPEALPYPTRGLDWYNKLREKRQASGPSSSSRTTLKLRIAIVGAGLAGVSAAIPLAKSGHEVTVYESAAELGEVGAGIQVSPNVTKYFWEWGIQHLIPPDTQFGEETIMRRWSDGAPLCRINNMQVARDWGAPFILIHRADLHRALVTTAEQSGAIVRTGCRVSSYNFSQPSITLTSGEVISNVDFIIASDGVKSESRRQLLGDAAAAASPQYSGQSAYRVTLPMSSVIKKPNILDPLGNHMWVGPGKHVVTYPICEGRTVNVVMCHNDPTKPSNWDPSTYVSDFHTQISGWDAKLVALLEDVKEVTKWPITYTAPLEKWSSESGRFIIIGDAAHAMAPYMAQGAAMAIEDGVALAQILIHLTSIDQLKLACDALEHTRIPRAQNMQLASKLNGFLWHLPDGEVQEARDEASKPSLGKLPYKKCAFQVADPTTQRWVYGFDARREADKAWEHVLSKAATAELRE